MVYSKNGVTKIVKLLGNRGLGSLVYTLLKVNTVGKKENVKMKT